MANQTYEIARDRDGLRALQEGMPAEVDAATAESVNTGRISPLYVPVGTQAKDQAKA